MNIIRRVSNPLIEIPATFFWLGVGGAVGAVVFNKLSHLVEYALNKRFGDYDHPQQTLDDRIIVSMGHKPWIYYAQNAVLAGLVTAVASLVVRTLLNRGYPEVFAGSLLVGSVAAPILFAAVNLVAWQAHRRWVVLSEAEVARRGINPAEVEKIRWSEYVYPGLGCGPKWRPGLHSDSD